MDEFMRNHGQTGFIPLDQMEALKEGAYASTPNNAFVQQPTAAKRMLDTHFAGMLQREIEQGTRGFENGGRSVADLNRQYGQLKNLQDAIEASGRRAGASPLTVVGEILGGQAIGHPVLGPLAWETLRSPQASQVLFHAPLAGRAAIAPLAVKNALQEP